MLAWFIRFLIRWAIRLAILLWPVTLIVGAVIYLRYA